MDEFFLNPNPLAETIFNINIANDCYIYLSDEESDDDIEKVNPEDAFNLFCDEIKQFLLEKGSGEKSFTY